MRACFSWLTLAAVLGLFSLAGLFQAGCEDDSDLNGSEFYIDPPNLTMAATNSAVRLTAMGGDDPFTWDVSDETLGAVSGTGRTVVYARTAQSGINIVQVSDSRTWTAVCYITQ